MPFVFEATESAGEYLARGPGYLVRAGERGIDLALGVGADVRLVGLRLVGADRSMAFEPEDRQPGVTHDLRGSPSRWRRGIQHYARLRCAEVYPGVDFELHGNAQQLEYDFAFAAGVDPSVVRMLVVGAGELRVDAATGALLLGSDSGAPLRQLAPIAWQFDGAMRHEVEVRYRLLGSDMFGFEVVDRDPALPLVIDPVVAYGSFLGGNNTDVVTDIAVDPMGNAYLVGYTLSSDFPRVGSSRTLTGLYDGFVAKVDPTGSTLIYSTYLGGSGTNVDIESCLKVGADAQGHAIVVGKTNAPDFPVANAFQPQLGGGWDAFVSKLLPDGSGFVYSTYLGGSGYDNASRLSGNINAGGDVVVDASGRAWVTGTTDSVDFPVRNAMQPRLAGGGDAFVAAFDPAGSLLWSTYLGGSSSDSGYGIVRDGNGEIYLAGFADSSDFPRTPGTHGTRGSGFATKLQADGAAIVWSTKLWTPPLALDVDPTGAVYIGGTTRDPCFPVTFGAWQTEYTFASGNSGQGDGWLAKLSPDAATLVWSTYLGVYDLADAVADLKVDVSGHVYALFNGDAVTGGVTAGVKVVKMNTQGSALSYEYRAASGSSGGTGMAVAADGSIWIGGATSSPSGVPITPGVFQPNFVGGGAGFLRDGFVVRLDDTFDGLAAVTVPSPKLARGSAMTAAVTVAGRAPVGGHIVQLTAQPAGIVSLPASVTVPAGGSTALFTISAAVRVPRTAVLVTASAGGRVVQARFEVWAGATYRITDLGRINGGPVAEMFARSISNRGVSAGYGRLGNIEQGYLHRDANGFEQIGLVPEDLADSGIAAGKIGVQPGRFVPGQGSSVVPLVGGATQGLAFGVNDLGQVAGVAFTQPGGLARAFLFTPGAGSLNLGTLPGGVASEGRDVNNRGHVAGQSFTDPSGSSFGGQHAFLWTPSGGMRDLGTLPGHLYSHGRSLNDLDEVTGLSVDRTQSGGHAFRLSGGQMLDLGVLQSGDASSGEAINAHGDVVGSSTDTRANARAFVYTDGGGMQALVDLLDPADAFGWDLTAARDINDLGQIVGDGTSRDNAPGNALVNCEDTAFRLDPLHAVPYGTGCPGSGGVQPYLAADGMPAIGTTFSLRVAGGAPGAPAVMLIASTRANIPILGCSLLVGPLLADVPLALDLDGRVRLPLSVALHLPQADLTVQVVIADAGAANGLISATNGVELRLR